MVIKRVVITEPTPYTHEVRAVLGAGISVREGPLTRGELLKALNGCHALFARLGHQIDRELIAMASTLRVIATPTTGLTHIDTLAADEAGISILSLRGENELLKQLPATAELTWALLLAVRRKIAQATRHTAEAGWNRDMFWSSELAGKTLGIIGHGRIGRMVAKYGEAFGMRVLACDCGAWSSESSPAQLVSLGELLVQSDVVSLHASYKQGDLPLLGKAEFSALKPGCLFINTSRGELVDERALADALQSGHLGGAGLDVLRNEPEVDGQLTRLQFDYNLVITPHIGGATHESIGKTEVFMAHRLREFMEKHCGPSR